jgi:hypothetical protein
MLSSLLIVHSGIDQLASLPDSSSLFAPETATPPELLRVLLRSRWINFAYNTLDILIIFIASQKYYDARLSRFSFIVTARYRNRIQNAVKYLGRIEFPYWLSSDIQASLGWLRWFDEARRLNGNIVRYSDPLSLERQSGDARRIGCLGKRRCSQIDRRTKLVVICGTGAGKRGNCVVEPFPVARAMVRSRVGLQVASSFHSIATAAEVSVQRQSLKGWGRQAWMFRGELWLQ